jgi:hypothetical protein
MAVDPADVTAPPRPPRPARAVLGRPAVLLAGVVALGVLLRLHRFDAPILDAHAFRQTQTASTVWLWNRDGFDALDYRVPMYGGGHWVLELPVYQAMVWVLQVPAGGIEHAARVVSIGSYVAVAVLMYLIAARWFGSRAAALLGVGVFTLLPVTVFFFRAVLIDTLLIATTLLAVLAATHLGERFTWTWFAVFAAALAVSVLGKATLVLAIGLAMVVPLVRLLRDGGVGRLPKAAVVGTCALTGLLFAAWARHGDELNTATGTLSISEARSWYFGSTFTDPDLYRVVGGRIADNLGVAGLVALAIGLVAIPRLRTAHRPEIILTLAGAVLSCGIFANLNRIHDYYQLAYYVPLSMVAGLGLAVALRAATSRVGAVPARAAVAAVLVVIGVVSAVSLRDGYFAPDAVAYSVEAQGRELRAETPDAPLLLIHRFADPNDPVLWYQARRIGWRVPAEDAAGAARIAAAHPEIAAVVWITDPDPEPPHVAALARAAGLRRAHVSAGMTVYR